MMEQGLLHLYWGDGKGKTTAAMGLALRALGSGKRVVIVQFLKGGQSGEIPLLAQLGAKIFRGKGGQFPIWQLSGLPCHLYGLSFSARRADARYHRAGVVKSPPPAE